MVEYIRFAIIAEYIINRLGDNNRKLCYCNLLRSISEVSSCFLGPRPWHIEIRHRVKKASTINLFGFETQIENPKIEIMEPDRT